MSKRKKVAVWGTFDLLHDGHIIFLKNAALLGDLYVIIIPDEQVEENKGYLPDNDEETRKKNIEMFSSVKIKEVHIDCIKYGLESIIKIKPDYFCLGYDQDHLWEEILKKELEKKNIYVEFRRLDRYADGIHSRFLRKGRKVEV